MKVTWKELSLGIILGLCIGMIAVGYQQNRELEELEQQLASMVEPVVVEYKPVAVQAMEDIVANYEETEEEIRVGAPYSFLSLDDEYQIYLEERCADLGINFWVAASLMFSESSFDPGCYGDGNTSVGLFQIHDCWWGYFDDECGLDVFIPLDNIEAGLIILKDLMDKFPDDAAAVIMCYKCGEYRGRELMAEGFYLDSVDEILNRAIEWSNRKEP